MLVKEPIDSSKDVGREEPQERMPTQLMDLPSHLLHSIISKVGYRHQKLLRRVSKDMRQLHNAYILHHHETVVRTHRKKCEESVDIQKTRTMLQTLKHAISYYRSIGFENYYANSLLHFYENLEVEYGDADGDPQTQYMSAFIKQFLDSLERPYVHRVPVSKRQKFHELRLLYTLSLFNLLRQFQNFRIVGWGMNLLHWQLQVEVNGIFMGVVEEREVRTRAVDQIKRNDFMAMMAELLYYETLQRRFCGYKDAGSIIYSYGVLRQPLTKRSTRLLLKFFVVAPQIVLRILQDAITGKCESLSPNSMPHCTAFSMRLEVNAKRSCRFLDLGSMHISVLQFTELV
ncbi:uncharacterized protein Dana_GF10166 [Drosophila ananassae]|uniref:F-box domain-containing protein n=1 Tax=Drosophila ananassae TaxID=7217 RepID=B3M6A8_DROAN|nr:uncharacterized protein LOC6493040 [Drosophila ananassae]EDV39728.1 uncharacterized protein Dana_GF10166 [Drosophila ananassae]